MEHSSGADVDEVVSPPADVLRAPFEGLPGPGGGRKRVVVIGAGASGLPASP